MPFVSPVSSLSPLGLSSFNWATWWASQPECVELWLKDDAHKNDDGNYVGLRNGDILTIIDDTPGAETFQCPNTATYIAADTDNLWFTGIPALRTATTANLIGFDFIRTIVKYQDNAPNSIVAIMILSSDIGAAKIDKLHRDFWLSIFWSGVWNDFGHLKSNKGLHKYYWVLEYQNIYDYWVDTLGGVAPSEADNIKYRNLIRQWKDIGYWDTRDRLTVTSIHTNDVGEALVNWKNPGTGDLEIVLNGGTMNFTAYEGFQSDDNAYIRTHYIPSVDGVNYLQNNASSSCYLRLDISENSLVVGFNGTYDVGIQPRYLTTCLVKINSGSLSSDTNTDSRGMFTANRVLSTHQDLIKNKTRIINDAIASIGIPEGEIYLLSNNAPGFYSKNQISFWQVGAGVTQELNDNAVDIFEEYMDANEKGVIT